LKVVVIDFSWKFGPVRQGNADKNNEVPVLQQSLKPIYDASILSNAGTYVKVRKYENAAFSRQRKNEKE
jgi:hypothetical protein